VAIRLTTLGRLSVLKDGVEEPAFLAWKQRLALEATVTDVERRIISTQTRHGS